MTMFDDKDEIKFGYDLNHGKKINMPDIRVPNIGESSSIQAPNIGNDAKLAKWMTEGNNVKYDFLQPQGVHSQECVIKMSFYTGHNAATQAINTKAAIDYLLKNEDVKPFGNMGTENPDEVIERIGSKKVFKMIISPEITDMSHEQLMYITRQTIEHVMAVTGVQFNWVAAIHTDRAHLHSHVIIDRESGGCTKTAPLYIPPAQIKNEIRKYTMDLINNMFGFKSEEEFRADFARHIDERVPSKIDYALRYLLNSDVYSREYPKIDKESITRLKQWQRPLAIQRLHNLADYGIGVIEHDNGNYYFTSPRWLDDLRVSDRMQVYSKYVTKHDKMHVDSYDSADKSFIDYKGKIISKHLDDMEAQEVSWLVLDDGGEYHYYQEKNVTRERFMEFAEGKEVLVYTTNVEKGSRNYQRPRMKAYNAVSDNSVIQAADKKRQRMKMS